MWPFLFEDCFVGLTVGPLGCPHHFRVFREGLSLGLFESFDHWPLLLRGVLQACHQEFPLHLALGWGCLYWRNSTIIWCWVEALECLTNSRQEVLGWTLCLSQLVIGLQLASLRGGLGGCCQSRVEGVRQVPSSLLVGRLRGLLKASLWKLGIFAPPLPSLCSSVLRCHPGEPVAGQQLWLHGMSWLWWAGDHYDVQPILPQSPAPCSGSPLML